MSLTLEQEQAILALLDEQKFTLSELDSASELSGSDLMLVRQGILDKSLKGETLKRYVTPPAASLMISGLTKLSNAVNSSAEDIAATSKAVKSAYDLAGKALMKESNLADLTNVTDALKNLDLGEVAKKIDGAVPINQGGTGATTVKAARENLELDDAITESNSPFKKNGCTYKSYGSAAFGMDFFSGDNAEGLNWNTYGRRTLEYSTNAITMPIAGGSWTSWRERGTALLVECPTAETTAHSIFKAVQWGRDWLLGFDVHYPIADVITSQLHVGGADFHFNSVGQLTHSNGIQWCTHYPDGNTTGPVWAGNNLRGELHASGVSDRNHKVFIEPTKVDPMDYISKMEFVQFGWKNDMYPYKDTTEVPLGVIAQDLQQIDPALVTTRPDGTLAADLLQVTVVALAAVKQLNERVIEIEKLATK